MGILELIVLLVLFVGIPVMGMAAAGRKREFKHAERMKALEMGRPLPREEGQLGLILLATAIGLVVPIGVFVCCNALYLSELYMRSEAGRGNIQGPGFETNVPSVMWIAAAVVGTTSVVCGTVLAVRLIISRDRSRISASDTDTDLKPSYDPDALDVVSRRG